MISVIFQRNLSITVYSESCVSTGQIAEGIIMMNPYSYGYGFGPAPGAHINPGDLDADPSDINKLKIEINQDERIKRLFEKALSKYFHHPDLLLETIENGSTLDRRTLLNLYQILEQTRAKADDSSVSKILGILKEPYNTLKIIAHKMRNTTYSASSYIRSRMMNTCNKTLKLLKVGRSNSAPTRAEEKQDSLKEDSSPNEIMQDSTKKRKIPPKKVRN